MAAHHLGDEPVAPRDDRGEREDDGRPKIAAQYGDLGDNCAREEYDGVARTEKHCEAEDKTEARVPRRDRYALVFVDETQPLQQYICCNDSSREETARQGPTELRRTTSRGGLRRPRD